MEIELEEEEKKGGAEHREVCRYRGTQVECGWGRVEGESEGKKKARANGKKKEHWTSKHEALYGH